MGDRHGGRFARRGRALNPHRPQVDAHRPHVDAHRGVRFRWRATVFRCRGVVGRICPTRKGSPRRRPPETAHERKGLPRARTLPTAKASRHGARAKGFARAETLSSAKASRTAHERKDLPRAGSLPTTKAYRHGARAKGFAPRRNTPLGEGLPTRRTSERICPARERSPRRRSTDTAHERKDLPRAGTLPTAKASRHGARAKGFAPRGSRSPHGPTNGGPPSTDGQPKNTPSAGSHPRGRGRCRVHSH